MTKVPNGGLWKKAPGTKSLQKAYSKAKKNKHFYFLNAMIHKHIHLSYSSILNLTYVKN